MDIKKIDTSKWLIPVLAILVIIESVFIVQKLSNQKSDNWEDKDLPTSLQPEKEQTTLSLEGFETIQEGEEGQVSVVMTPYKNLSLDGVDILIEYNPEDIEVLGTDPSGRFSRVGRNWIEPEKERVLVSLVQLDQVVDFEAGQKATLLTLRYRAKRPGQTELKIKKADAGGTNLVGQGSQYPFQTENLDLTIK